MVAHVNDTMADYLWERENEKWEERKVKEKKKKKVKK